MIVPTLVVTGAIANEALQLNETLLPRVQQMIDDPAEFDAASGCCRDTNWCGRIAHRS